MELIHNETMPAIRERRAGRIYVYPERFYGTHGWETLMKIMGSILPVRVEHHYIDKRLEVWCYSEMFDKVELGHQIPEYRVEIDFHEEKETTEDGRTNYFMKAEAWRFIKL